MRKIEAYRINFTYIAAVVSGTIVCLISNYLKRRVKIALLLLNSILKTPPNVSRYGNV